MNKSYFCSTLLCLMLNVLTANAQDTIRFSVCPKMWSTGAPVSVSSITVSANNASFPIGQLSFYPVAGNNCIEVVIPPSFQQPNATYSIYGSKADDGLNGITINDMWALRLHILGVTPYTSPFPVLASDVNSSLSATTLDIVLINKKILGQSVTGSFSWYSVPSYWNFNQMFPLAQNGCCDDLTLTELAAYDGGSMNLIFYKKGDVDGDANPLFSTYSPNYTESVHINMTDQTLTAGNLATVSVTPTANTAPIGGFQFELEYDPNSMEILAVEGDEFGVQYALENEVIKVTGVVNATNAIIPNELFRIKVKSLASGKVSDFLKLKEDGTSAMILSNTSSSSQIASVAVNFLTNAPTMDSWDVQKVVVSPNPAGAAGTNLLFQSGASGISRLFIKDLEGKTIFQKDIMVQHGNNQIALPAAAFPVSGVCFFQFELNGKVVSGKVLR